MAKQDNSKGKNEKLNPLDNVSVDGIKSAGTGADKKKEGKRFNKKFNRNGSKKGDHFRNKSNDPSWYVANPAIVRDVASLPFAVYNGVTYKQFANALGNNINVSADSNYHVTIPGVAIYKYAPWYGTANPTSALNLTMRALYSFVRHVNSGRTNYEAPDLIMYVMAMDSVYLLIHEIKRLIRLAYLYVLENRDIPEKIFSVLGIDHKDLIGNLANYRAQLNTRIAKANSLAVPANFNLFKRRSVMGSVVLTDEPNRPTQLIVPIADGFYKFTVGSTGSTLEYVIPGSSAQNDSFAVHVQRGGDNTFIKTKTRVNDYFQLLDNMLTVLLSDEDINIMSGDIIKAYGDNLYRLPFIEENEMQDIIHDENLLLQFTNSTVLDIPTASFGRFSATDTNKGIQAEGNLVTFETAAGTRQDMPVITQRNGSIVANCAFHAPNGVEFTNKKKTKANSLPLLMLDNIFIDTTDANGISPENILEWTRLTMCFNSDDNWVNWYYLEAGVEMGLGWLVAQPASYIIWPDALKNKEEFLDQTLSVQWFQFGRRNSLDSRVVLPPSSAYRFNADYPLYATYVINEEINANFTSTSKFARKYNTMYASKFMEGLSYGPRAYETGSFELVGNGIKMFGDMAVGKLGEKTALANRFNISAMHDAALLGLISSPYVTTSK